MNEEDGLDAIQVTFLVIIVIEVLSVLELYFLQDRCIFNGVAMFKVCKIAQQDPELFGMIRYLVNWVAGVKLIVIGLLSVIVFTGEGNTLLYAAVALMISIASFFWRMYPMSRHFDEIGQIEPAGRSRTLGMMVFSLEIFLTASIALSIFSL
jgi:hypothetical protein